ncbi:hypothetical protein [Pseudomonas sp. JBR1]|uniref:hypothetical protein n=1 Tax=Pseudomonas sp. JBR1 TaxID=3020907 RepID=UPI0023069A38|nr:hypothetical protein [Pseudomonas sp. JBR1]WCE09462.1 hypothetical protein PJ259_04230 [Pseudomonas sp. JBR1]
MPYEHIEIGEEADKSHWPAGVSAITIGQMDMIGVDREGSLYWDGKPIEVKKRLSLTVGERVFAVLVGGVTSVSAVVQALGAGCQAHFLWMSWLCPGQ